MKKLLLTTIIALAMLGFSAVAAVAETIKIGAILAVTGGASFLGAPEARTLEMLAEELNEQGGINGKKVELIIRDSAGSPERAMSFTRQLIEEQRVFAIIGPSTSGETMRIKQIAEGGRTILISLAAAEAIVNPLARYVFKTPQNDRFAAMQIFKTMNDMGISKIAVVSGNTGFGQAGRNQIAQIAPDYGIEILENEVYDSRATDLSALVTRLMSNREVEAVVNWSIVPAQAILARNMRQAGWEVPLFQSHGFGNIRYVEAAGRAAEGIIFPAGRLLVADVLPADHPQKEVLVTYQENYEARFNEPVSTFGGHAYDAFHILVRAIEEAGTDREAVRDAIENMQGFVGTGGIFNFSATDHNGLDIDAFSMLTVKDGQFVKLEQ
ncbi:ABC transporter substrate-binding protein [Desulfurivibrio alkaliphilus]|uniref:Extracellular ligand-binding receptor n=1 Tax=Desulfurivibrio alkaliphilus (strain DSM 19089 / UNIQEM U267 / AHT2) TaxID=589865 RepID=D6Z5T6_DESAT|nr:ABC transporter substrate-binding protein [Desulfurivibrio alkaliphilus]ADH84818.1 Extracellular ligand-binding receptor [Desulfurivibrio alkaliphilus AHT 2]